jgi:hypothetical protein
LLPSKRDTVNIAVGNSGGMWAPPGRTTLHPQLRRIAVFRWLTYRVRAFWVLLPVCAALAAAIGWWQELRPVAAEWGTISSWVATIGGLVAVTFAGSQLRLVLLQRRQAMGDSLAVILERLGTRGHSRLKVELVNAGQFGVHSVRVVLVERDDIRWEERSAPIGPPGGVVVPGTPTTVHCDLTSSTQSPTELGVRVAFVDVEGRPWTSIHTLDGQKLR